MQKIIHQLKAKSEELLTFFHAILANPRQMGAFWPSSPFLANEMASYVQQIKPNEIVVELGPGTGVVTEALLKQGCAPENIVALEYSAEFSKQLLQRFPTINVIQGDATHLTELLVPYHGRITHFVSSLPLRTLPLATSKTILAQIETLLPPKGRYIQFTYSFKYNTFGQLSTFKHITSKRVWLNLPSARVDVWEKI